MKYLQKSFTVPVQVDVSQEEWDAIFSKEKEPTTPDTQCPVCGDSADWCPDYRQKLSLPS